MIIPFFVNMSWFDYHLCVKNFNDETFQCKKFISFKDADCFFYNNYNKENVEISTIIPITKFPSQRLRLYVLHKELSKIAANKENTKQTNSDPNSA